MEKILRERFEIPSDFDEFKYYKEPDGTENFKWINRADSQSVRIILFDGTAYHYLHYIPHESESSFIDRIELSVALNDEDKMFAEDFLKKMFFDDAKKLHINLEKSTATQFDNYKYLKIEYEQFSGERYVYSYGAKICMNIYKDKRIVTECIGWIAPDFETDAPFILGEDDYKKAFPIELYYKEIFKRGTLPVYSVKVGFLSEIDKCVLETYFAPIHTMVHGYEFDDDTFYEDDPEKLAQIEVIDKNYAYDIILSKKRIRHVMAKTTNEEFVPAITIENPNGIREETFDIIATTGELLN